MFECKFDENILNEVADKKIQFRTSPKHPSTEEMAVELKKSYAEIERLCALIERAIEHIKEHEQCYATPNRMTQWLKDVERGGDE